MIRVRIFMRIRNIAWYDNYTIFASFGEDAITYEAKQSKGFVWSAGDRNPSELTNIPEDKEEYYNELLHYLEITGQFTNLSMALQDYKINSSIISFTTLDDSFSSVNSVSETDRFLFKHKFNFDLLDMCNDFPDLAKDCDFN